MTLGLSKRVGIAPGARPRPPAPGADGHTASIVPGDSVLDTNNTDVGLTGAY